MRYDVTILGGGPAGTAAALSLRQLLPGAKVVLVEASNGVAWRPGETLPPGCRWILESLDCWEAFCAEGFIEGHGTTAAWGSGTPFENPFLFSARGSGWHVDRGRFDCVLRARAEKAGVEVWRGARLLDAAWCDDHWRIAVHQRGSLESRFVIDATGRTASFARRQGARILADDRLVGVVGVVRAAGRHWQTLVEAQEEGWWYSTTIPGSLLVVAWMSDSDLVRRHSMWQEARWFERLRRSSLTAARVGDASLERSLRFFAANSQRISPAGGPGWVAAGDASATCDPLASQGILRALRSGKVASFAAKDWLGGNAAAIPKYDRLMEAQYETYRETKDWYYGQEQRWPGSEFWQRRQRARGAALTSAEFDSITAGVEFKRN